MVGYNNVGLWLLLNLYIGKETWKQVPSENKREQSLLKNDVYIAELVNTLVTCEDVREEIYREETLYLVIFWNINSVDGQEILNRILV